MRDLTQLRRETTFDSWLDARFGSRAAVGPAEAPADFDDDLEAMTRVAELVKTHVAGPVPVTGESSRSLGIRGRSLVRVAAVVLVLAGLGIGLGLRAIRASQGPNVPAGALTVATMPRGLYNEIENHAGPSANPYPSTPVFWVKTTAGSVDRLLAGYHVAPQANIPARTLEWVGQVTSRFYGNPEHKSGIYSTILVVWAPPGHGRARIIGSQSSGFAPVPLSVLEQLGTVHRQYLRPPPPAPLLPPALEQNLTKHWKALFGDIRASVPALWVKTTLGKMGEGADRTFGLPTSPASQAVWVVQFRAVFGPSSVAAPRSDWCVTTGGRACAWQFSGHHLPLRARRIGDLAALGHIQEIWLNGGVPSTLAPQERQMLRTVIRGEYRSEISTLHVEWADTTVARLRSELPWTAIGPSVPGPTPVWIVEVSDSKAVGEFSDQWFMDWGNNPTSPPSPGYNSYSSEGGSGLFGITRLGQLGRVHVLNVASLLH
ncbi:MAG: hypothetical protein ACYDGN_17200 [Acidimicrobiales bacterium]